MHGDILDRPNTRPERRMGRNCSDRLWRTVGCNKEVFLWMEKCENNRKICMDQCMIRLTFELKGERSSRGASQ